MYVYSIYKTTSLNMHIINIDEWKGDHRYRDKDIRINTTFVCINIALIHVHMYGVTLFILKSVV